MSGSLLLLMTSGSSDLLTPAWKATLSPAFPGILPIYSLFSLSLHHFLRVSQTFESSYCGPGARIEFLGMEILTQPFLGAGPGSREDLLQPCQQQEFRAAGIPAAFPGHGWGGAAQELQNWGRTSLGFKPWGLELELCQQSRLESWDKACVGALGGLFQL